MRSRLGVGTRFTVDLPLPIDRSGTHIAAGHVQLLAGEPLRILLVEDDPTVAEAISGLLTNRGHRVVHAVHGLAALSETVDGGSDIALLDLNLPGRDGFALALQLRQLGHRFPLLAVMHRLTALRRPRRRPRASTDSCATGHCRSAGGSDYGCARGRRHACDELAWMHGPDALTMSVLIGHRIA